MSGFDRLIAARKTILVLLVASVPLVASADCKDDYVQAYQKARSMLTTASSKGGQCKMLAQNFASVPASIKRNYESLASLPASHPLWCDHTQMVYDSELYTLEVNLAECL